MAEVLSSVDATRCKPEIFSGIPVYDHQQANLLKKTPNQHSSLPHLPPCSLQMSPRTKVCPFSNRIQRKPIFTKLQFRVKRHGKGRFRNDYTILQRSNYKPSPAMSHQCSVSPSRSPTSTTTGCHSFLPHAQGGHGCQKVT